MTAGDVIIIAVMGCPAAIALIAGWPDLFMFRKGQGRRTWPK